MKKLLIYSSVSLLSACASVQLPQDLMAPTRDDALAATSATQAISERRAVLGDMASGQRLISPQQVMAESAADREASVQAGPQVAARTDDNARQDARVRIAQEVPQSYIDVDRGGQTFRVSLAFNRVSMLAVAQMFSEVTGVNILVGDEVQQSLVTANLMNVPWDRGLDAILKAKKLAKHVDRASNIIRIHDQATLVSLENFDRQRSEDLRKSLEAKRAVEPQYTEVFKLFYSDPSVVKGEIISVLSGGQTSVEAETKPAPQVTVDERINAVIVKGTRAELDLVHRLLEQVDVRTQQILIEAFVVEASDAFDAALGARLGLDLNRTTSSGNVRQLSGAVAAPPSSPGALTIGSAAGSLSNLPLSGAYGGIGVLLGTSTSALKAELFAMEKEGLSKIVSNPRIFTLDNQKAVVFQGEQIPFESASSDGTGTNVSFKDAGIKLTVVPSIVGDGNIVLDVQITKDSANYANAIGNNPPIDKREVQTKLLVQDRSVAVIGGVFKQEKSSTAESVPGLSDLPLLGPLFKRDIRNNQRTELLIFLAPRII